jgi:hypothetical protein
MSICGDRHLVEVLVHHLDGVFDVMMLTSGLERYLRTEYRVVVLPLPVGPVTRMMPVGRAMKS